MNLIKITLRLITLPLWSGLILVALIRDWIGNSYWYLRYGGEAITYRSKTEKETIAKKLRELIK